MPLTVNHPCVPGSLYACLHLDPLRNLVMLASRRVTTPNVLSPSSPNAVMTAVLSMRSIGPEGFNWQQAAVALCTCDQGSIFPPKGSGTPSAEGGRRCS